MSPGYFDLMINQITFVNEHGIVFNTLFDIQQIVLMFLHSTN